MLGFILKHTDYWQNTVADHAADPPRSHTQCSYTDNQDDHCRTFVPRSVGQGQVMFVRAGAVQNLSDQSQDVDCRNDDAAASSAAAMILT